MSDDVALTDLEVIQQFSLAVRGATAPRDAVVAALQADLAFLTGERRPSKPAPSTAAPKAPAPRVPASKAPAAKAPAAKPAAKTTAKAPAKKAAAPKGSRRA